MRILFKTPHQLIFRRCFFVKDYSDKDGIRYVYHGLFGGKRTEIPMEGTVFRFYGLRK